jgi:sugar/nucleoside kinase (ribokinase family)
VRGPATLCVGASCVDLALVGLTAPPVRGQIVDAENIFSCPGGMANVAVAIHRLGGTARLASAIGDDRSGEILRAMLEIEGVEVLPPMRGTRTDVTMCMPWGGERAMVSFRDATAPRMPDPDSPIWDNVDAVVIDVGCGLDPRIRAVAERGVALFGDMGWEQDRFCLDNCLEALPELTAFLPNQAQACALAETPDVDLAIERLAARAPTVVVKLGPRGATAASGGRRTTVEVPRVAAVDSTGAGDILDAGFVYGSLLGMDIDRALRLGCLAAAVSVTRPGSSASAPSLAELGAFVASLPEEERPEWAAVIDAVRTAVGD